MAFVSYITYKFLAFWLLKGSNLVKSHPPNNVQRCLSCQKLDMSNAAVNNQPELVNGTSMILLVLVMAQPQRLCTLLLLEER